MPPVLPNVKGNPLGGTLNTRGGKMCDFRLKSSFISETVRNRPLLLWNVIGQPIDLCRFRWPWMTLKGGTRVVNFFQTDLFYYARIVWPRTTKFGKITRGEGRISKDQPRPHRKGAGPSAPQFWGSLFMPSPFNAERPRSAKWHRWGGAWFFGSATPPVTRERSPSVRQFLGFPLFMFTPFDVELPTSATNTYGRGLFLGQPPLHLEGAWPQRTPTLWVLSYWCVLGLN